MVVRARLLLHASLFVGLLVPTGFAAQGVGQLSFDVASVRRSTEGGYAFLRLDGETLTVRNMTLRQLIGRSFRGYFPNEIIGGPSWIDKDRFEIVARTGRAGAPAFIMLRNLLVERFRLTTHVEQQDRPVYRLVLARSDGRLGPKLMRSTVDCTAGLGKPPGAGGCGHREDSGLLTGSGVPIALLTGSLSFPLGRRVVDETSLTGAFDLDLRWQPDEVTERDIRAPGSVGSSLPTALREQLGLRLLPDTGPVSVLVIDSAAPPTEN